MGPGTVKCFDKKKGSKISRQSHIRDKKLNSLIFITDNIIVVLPYVFADLTMSFGAIIYAVVSQITVNYRIH